MIILYHIEVGEYMHEDKSYKDYIIHKVSKQELQQNKEYFCKNIHRVYDLGNPKTLEGYDFDKYDDMPSSEIVYEELLNMYDKLDDYSLYVALDKKNNTIQSIANFEKRKNCWLIEAVQTHITARQQGVTTQLLQAGLNRIFDTVMLRVAQDNTPARNLYKKLGFRVSTDAEIQKAQLDMYQDEDIMILDREGLCNTR